MDLVDIRGMLYFWNDENVWHAGNNGTDIIHPIRGGDIIDPSGEFHTAAANRTAEIVADQDPGGILICRLYSILVVQADGICTEDGGVCDHCWIIAWDP